MAVKWPTNNVVSIFADKTILNTKCQPKFLLLFHFKKRRGKVENFTALFITLPCWNVNPKTQEMLD